MFRRYSSTIAWDGILPIVIALMPFVIRMTLHEGHMLEVAVAIVAPVLAAFLRAAIGIHQLDVVTKGKPNLSRQVLFALAIMLLLLVEVFVSTLQFARNEPLTAWFFPAGLFCLYLILIQNALAEDDESYSPIV